MQLRRTGRELKKQTSTLLFSYSATSTRQLSLSFLHLI